MGCAITTEYTRRGIETAFLENDHLRVEVLTGKGGDITEIRDKRTDVNVLFEAPHRWQAPSAGLTGAPDGSFAFLDHYPGGWQDVLPGAGGPATVQGAPLALHGESALVPWDATVTEQTAGRVQLSLSVSLARYPLDVERTLSLAAGESTLTVEETVTNRGEVGVDYSWLQHIALGRPLIGPGARLDVPCETVLADPEQASNSRFPPGESFDWPRCRLPDGETVDLREFPPKAARLHELVALTDLQEGRYSVENPDLGLGVTVRFPADVYEYLWYWRAFGGFEEAPFFGRNYTAGLEPATSVPNAGLQEAVENETADHLSPGERRQVSISVATQAVD